jgi:uncharacterized NAD-dependent epimerase/dehydratase family protein
MIRVRVVVKEDWVPKGKVFMIDAQAIMAAPMAVFNRAAESAQPDKLVLCHSDFDALKFKVGIEDHPEMELMEDE